MRSRSRHLYVVHGSASNVAATQDDPDVVIRVVHGALERAPFEGAWVAEESLRERLLTSGGAWPLASHLGASADGDLMRRFGRMWGALLRSEGWQGIWGAVDGVLSDTSLPWVGKGMRQATEAGFKEEGLDVAFWEGDGWWRVHGLGPVAEGSGDDRDLSAGVWSLPVSELAAFRERILRAGSSADPTVLPPDPVSVATLYERLGKASIVLLHDPRVLPVGRDEPVIVQDPEGTGLGEELLRQGAQVETDSLFGSAARGVIIWVDTKGRMPQAGERLIVIASRDPNLLAQTSDTAGKILCPDLGPWGVKALAENLLGEGRWLGRLPYELSGPTEDGSAMSHFGTEQPHPDPRLRWLEQKTSEDLVRLFLEEEQGAISRLSACASGIAHAVGLMRDALATGHRVVYLGAGSAGRAGMMDAAELPPTFGVPDTWVSAILAGGSGAFQGAREAEEDAAAAGAEAVHKADLGRGDVLIAVTAHGNTPYAVGAVVEGNRRGVTTVALVNNRATQISALASLTLELPTGPELLVGSTRLKAGTAEKIVLNMLSTLTMIGLGRTVDNLMVDFKPTNDKLRERACRVFTMATGEPRTRADPYFQLQGGSGTNVSLKQAIQAEREATTASTVFLPKIPKNIRP